MFTGHSQLVKDFKNLAKSAQLAHGYIFFGEPEVGKFYFARHLASLIEEGEFNLPKKPLQDALILRDASGIDEMRRIKNFLWQKPAVSKKRLVVVNSAQNLTTQAQNAILKITEEPPDHSLIILVTHQLDTLLPPLVSRMQKIYFGRLTDEEMHQIAFPEPAEGGRSRRITDEIIARSFGRPGRAFRLMEDSLTAHAEECAGAFLKASGKARSDLIKKLVDEQKESPELLDLFFESLILQLRKNSVTNVDTLRSVLHRLFLIKSYNTNKRIQLEAV